MNNIGLPSPGNWVVGKYGNVYNEHGVMVANVMTRLNLPMEIREAEEKANAKLMANSKALTELVLGIADNWDNELYFKMTPGWERDRIDSIIRSLVVQANRGLVTEIKEISNAC